MLHIKPDSRGRIQLPAEYRKVALFELDETTEGLVLYPLELSRAGADKRWLRADVRRFLRRSVHPKVRQWLESRASPDLRAVFLFGSHARYDSLLSSDLDYALVTNKVQSLSERTEISNSLTAALQHELSRLQRHGGSGVVSVTFVTSPQAGAAVPSLYFNIVTDGLLVCERARSGREWTDAISQIMRRKGARSEGEGKHRRWYWEA